MKCGLKAGGGPQAEICWEVDSNGEVCSKEGPEILLFHPRETCRSCFGEDTFSQWTDVFFIFAFVSNNHLLPQEMMYVWNGFTIVGKRPELTEGILSTLEKAEEQLRNDPSKENFLISGFFFNTDTRLTVYCVMCRPIRVPHGRWVRCPAAEGSVLKKSGTAGPGWDLLQLCNLQVSLSWCHCNTPEAFEWESTKSSQQKLLLQQSLQ